MPPQGLPLSLGPRSEAPVFQPCMTRAAVQLRLSDVLRPGNVDRYTAVRAARARTAGNGQLLTSSSSDGTARLWIPRPDSGRDCKSTR